MICSIKIKTVAIVLAVALAATGIISLFAVNAGKTVYNGKTIVLDAGHGGRDGGVTGVSTGVKESDINLAIVKATEGFLKEKGYNVVLTRKNTEGLYNIFSKNKKLDDLQKRCAIIEKAKPDLVVSIHQNSFPGSPVTGSQVFYTPDSESSRYVADSLQNVLNLTLGGKRPAMKGDYYILQCTPYTSVLVECGFLSNAAEEKLLLSAEYQQKIAYAIFSAIHSLLDDGDLPYYI